MEQQAIEKFTPGPWNHGFDDGSGVCSNDEGGWIVDSDGNGVVRGGRDDWGVKIGVISPIDAKLIAAAPEMYEAVKNYINAVEAGEVTDQLDAMKAAIKKATE